jgi:hypothetical protein
MPKGGTLSKIAPQENISLKAILFTNENCKKYITYFPKTFLNLNPFG